MPEIDDLETDVNALSDNDDSPIFEIIYDRIKAVFLTVTATAELNRARAVLRAFRHKIPNGNVFNEIRQNAKRVDERLTAMAVGDLLNSIRSRNGAITDLKARLAVEIKKGNADKSFLEDITAAIKNADKTIAEINTMIDKLKKTPASVVKDFRILLTTIGNINAIFEHSEV